MKYTVDAIELGPHFITFYIDPKPQGLMEQVYKYMRSTKHRLFSIQQRMLSHEPNDPKIYHPVRQPDKYKKIYKHFHIRTMGYPKEAIVEEFVELVERFADCSDYTLEYVELPRDYPMSWPKEEDKYLELIDTMRNQ